jgi:hypothetical protein
MAAAKKTKGRRRQRAVQVYLSESEVAAMRTLAKCDGNLTLSQLLRQWIARAQRERQLELTVDQRNALALDSLAAFTTAARRHGLLPSDA